MNGPGAHEAQAGPGSHPRRGLRGGGVRARLIAMAVIPIVAFITMGVVGTVTFREVRVQGPNYNRIIQAKDLVADVLPPPEYVVEAYLTVLQLSDPSSVETRDQLMARLEQLEQEYQDRHQLWQRELTDPSLRQALLVDSYRPAIQFFDLVNQEFLPDVKAKRYRQARELANGELQARYQEHRSAVNRVVRLGMAQQRDIEAQTAVAVENQRLLLGTVLLGLIMLTLGIGIAIMRSILQPIARLERIVTEELPQAIERARASGLEDDAPPQVIPAALSSNDEMGRAAAAFNTVVNSAVELAREQARQRRNTSETFIHLGRRNQSLVARQLRHIDELERSEGDPALLKHLFRLDHLATRMRRNAESLLVLAGVEPARKWKQPVPVLDVIRASLGEVEGYERVRLDVIQPALLPGFAIADFTHMLAELIENALRFSPPDTAVTVTSGYLDGHYQIAIIDHGIGMAPRDVTLANERLHAEAGFDDVPSASLGLYVVARLARRYGISVELVSDGDAGLAAYVSLPLSFLEPSGPESGRRTGAISAPAITAPAITAPALTSVQREAAAPAGYGASTMYTSNAGRVAGPDYVTATNIRRPQAPQAPQAEPLRAEYQPPIARPPIAQPPVAQPPVAQPPPRVPEPGPSRADYQNLSSDQALFTARADEFPADQSTAPGVAPAAGPAFSPSTWATASSTMTGRLDVTGPQPPLVPASSRPAPSMPAPSMPTPSMPAPSTPSQLDADDGVVYTRAGLRKRSSKLGQNDAASPAQPQADHRQERAPDEVRSRYDTFVAGKRRALDAPEEMTDPGQLRSVHNPTED